MRSVGRCTAFRSCRRRAKYTSPGQWCGKHWAMWWEYGVKSREDLPYMPDRSGEAAVERACQLVTDLRSEVAK